MPQRVRNGTVTFVNTKSKRARSIPISAELEQQLKGHFTAHGPFSNCLNSFDKALKASGLVPPAGQSSHVLRHTFASHFIMNGGNTLTLQKILGYTSLAMTMQRRNRAFFELSIGSYLRSRLFQQNRPTAASGKQPNDSAAMG